MLKHPFPGFINSLLTAVTTASQAEALREILEGWEELFEAKKDELVPCIEANEWGR